jgi:transcriptional regulator with XRE-family HTH domain
MHFQITKCRIWYAEVQMAANRVRELRERLLLTQEALAFRCRVATRTAVTWEKGEKSPNSRNRKRLAKVLGVSVDELGLGETNDGHPDTGVYIG